VYVIHRRSELRASQIMQSRVLANPRIEIIWSSEVKEVLGDQTVTGLQLLNNQTGEETKLVVDGMFLAIGHVPQTDFLKGQVELDERGYIKLVDGVKTSVSGVFVAGDVADPNYQQAITAAGMGCRAAIEVEKYLTDQGVGDS